MTQEEKELLLKDLCARLPYGVMVDRLGVPHKVLSIKTDSIEIDRGEYMPAPYYLDEIKPYLRPKSSMTEEEKVEYDQLCYNCQEQDSVDYNITQLDRTQLIYVIDWLNSHHFDYRGLIEKGLALEAPEGMYQIQ